MNFCALQIRVAYEIEERAVAFFLLWRGAQSGILFFFFSLRAPEKGVSFSFCCGAPSCLRHDHGYFLATGRAVRSKLAA
jgi:hypothetical protein